MSSTILMIWFVLFAAAVLVGLTFYVARRRDSSSSGSADPGGIGSSAPLWLGAETHSALPHHESGCADLNDASGGGDSCGGGDSGGGGDGGGGGD